MANLIIPVSVDTGNSLQKLKQVGDGVNNLGNGFQAFRQQVKVANFELISSIEKYGAFSKQAADAGKKVADLKDKIGDAAQIAKGFNPETSFQNLSGAIQGAVGALNVLVGAQALFGDKSKAVEETLKKVQGALALSQGINSILQAKDSIVALGVSLNKIFSSFLQVQKASAGFSIIGAAAKSAGTPTLDFTNKIASTSNALISINKNLGITNTLQQRFNAIKGISAALTDKETASNVKLVVSQTASNATQTSRIQIQNSVLASTVETAAANSALAATMNATGVASTGASVGLSAFSKALISTGIGAFVVGLGLLIAYWDDISKAIGGATKYQKEYNDGLKAFRDGYADAKVQVDNVLVSLDNYKKGLITQEQFLSKYNDTLGETFGRTNDVIDAEKTIVANKDLFIKATAEKAKAQAFFAISAQASAKALTAEQEDNLSIWNKLTSGYIAQYIGIGFASKYSADKQLENTAKIIKSENAKASVIGKAGQQALSQALQFEKAFVKTEQSIGTEAKKVIKETIDENISLRKTGLQRELQEVTKGKNELLDKLKNSGLNQKQIEEGRAAILENAELKIRDIRKKYGEQAIKDREQANNVLFQIQLRGASETQRKILEIERKFEEDKKILIAAGIKDFTALEEDREKQITKVYSDEFSKRQDIQRQFTLDNLKKLGEDLKKQKEIILSNRDLTRRAELSAIKDQGAKRLAQLTDDENKEISQQKKLYDLKLITLDTYLKNVANIEAYYRNERSQKLTDEQQKELQRVQDQQALLTDALSSATEAAVTAIAEGGDPFAAAFKSLANSLGSFLINIGKEGLKAAIALKLLKKSIAGPQGIFASLAVIALGALIKAAFNKKAEKGFARGGYVDGPGTETSDSIPAQLSKGEYVIKARSVRKYGKDFLNKINNGEPQAPVIRSIVKGDDPFSSKSRALVNAKGGFISGPGTETSDSIRAMLSKGEFVVNAKSVRKYGIEFFDKINRGIPSPEPYRALVNRSNPLGLDSGSRALVNKFRDGGLVGLDSRWRAAVNRFDSNPLGLDSGSRALVNRPIPDTPRVTNRNVEMGGDTGGFMPFIAETKISGQDLKIILARADKRYSNVT